MIKIINIIKRNYSRRCYNKIPEDKLLKFKSNEQQRIIRDLRKKIKEQEHYIKILYVAEEVRSVENDLKNKVFASEPFPTEKKNKIKKFKKDVKNIKDIEDIVNKNPILKKEKEKWEDIKKMKFQKNKLNLNELNEIFNFLKRIRNNLAHPKIYPIEYKKFDDKN